MEEKKKKKQDPQSQSLDKALRILEKFSVENPEWGIREIARDLEISPTMIYRLVSSLHSAGFLEQNSSSQRYTLGLKVIKLANVYSSLNPLPDFALKIFEKFSQRFTYNFYFGRLSNFEVIYLSVLDGRGPIKIVVEPGGSTFLHSTALGKVLLAFQDDSFIEEYLGNGPLTPFTERSITDPDQLLSHLQEIRRQRYAVNNGEHYDAIGAVGVPIIEKNEQVRFGVSLAYPRQLILDQSLSIDDLVEIANEVAQELSLRISFPVLS